MAVQWVQYYAKCLDPPNIKLRQAGPVINHLQVGDITLSLSLVFVLPSDAFTSTS